MSLRGIFGSLRLSDKRLRLQRKERVQRDAPEVLPEAARSDPHEKTLGCLDMIYRIVEKDETRVYLDATFVNSLDIKCEDLVLNEDGSYSTPGRPCFFQPYPLNQLNAHPIDLQDFSTREDIKRKEACWEGVEDFKESYSQEAGFLCAMMDWTFRQCKRTGGENGQTKLRWLTNWKQASSSGSVIHDDFHDTVFHSLKWSPLNAWQAPKGKPHVMFMMKHGYPGDERLFRGEVLAIVATMITRLEKPSFRRHNINPVMVFSFMGGKQGRILQAHFNGQELVIRKTKLYDFSTFEKARRPIEVFSQFMTSDMVGDTQHLDAT